MAPIGTLWGDLAQRQTKVILTVAALNDLELTLPKFQYKDKPKDFVSAFPYAKIPAYEDSEGWKLCEGTPIARYLCEIGKKVQLLGSNAKEAAIVDQWVHFAEYEIGVPSQNALFLVFGFSGPFNRETLDNHTASLTNALTYLDSHLATRTYVALDTLSFADLALVGVVFHARRASLGIAEVAKYRNVFAHYARVTEDERIRKFNLWGEDRMPFVDVALTEPRPFVYY